MRSPRGTRRARAASERALRKLPYIDPAWCAEVRRSPLRSERQPDGRMRFWGRVPYAAGTSAKVLRVVTLEDGETIHNAFFDRSFMRRLK